MGEGWEVEEMFAISNLEVTNYFLSVNIEYTASPSTYNTRLRFSYLLGHALAMSLILLLFFPNVSVLLEATTPIISHFQH